MRMKITARERESNIRNDVIPTGLAGVCLCVCVRMIQLANITSIKYERRWSGLNFFVSCCPRILQATCVQHTASAFLISVMEICDNLIMCIWLTHWKWYNSLLLYTVQMGWITRPHFFRHCVYSRMTRIEMELKHTFTEWRIKPNRARNYVRCAFSLNQTDRQ